MLALSFLLGIYLARGRAPGRGLQPHQVVDLSVYILIAAIVGARLFYIVVHPEQFRDNPLDAINVVKGIAGLTMYGGLIFATIVSLWYMHRKKIAAWRMADVMAPSLALGLGLTRIGCFLNGCCHGGPTDLPWGCVFPANNSSVAGYYFPGQAIHPTQLYESLFGFTLFGLFLLLDRKRKFDGFLFWFFVLLYSTFRFMIDFIRFYESEMIVNQAAHSFSWTQIISLALFLISISMLVKLRRHGAATGGAKTAAPKNKKGAG
jgi:phosphatidylglycerol:prolipoprotein diacylglycerol transferase